MICKIILLLTITIWSTQAIENVEVVDGVIKIPKAYSCDINVNGVDMVKNETGVIKGLYFGIIRYDCKNITGILVSKLECKMCGLFCNYNQLIVGCEQYWGPFLVGLIIGLVPIIIILFLFRHIVNSLMTKLVEHIIYKYNIYKDKKESKKSKNIELRTGLKIKPLFKEPMNTKEKYITKVVNKRAEFDPTYIELYVKSKATEYKTTGKDQGPSAPSNDYDMRPEVPRRNTITVTNTPEMNIRKYPSLTSIALGALIVTANLPVGDCCDNTLFIYSNGKVCDSNKCVDSGMYDIPLVTGSMICFKDLDGEIMKVKIDESYYRLRYYLQYYTSDYSLETTSISRCKGAGDCWDGGCNADSISQELKLESNGTVNGYGCQSDTIGCDSYCYHQTSCTWFKWMMRSVGPLIPVYMKMSEIWEAVFRVEYKGIVIKHKVNVNNPRLNLDGIMTSMPLYITSFTSEQTTMKNGLIIKDGQGYQAKVSDMNMPQTDIVGDYQISLDMKSYIYNELQIKCQSNSCKTKCKLPESKIKRFIGQISKMEGMETTMIGNKYIVETVRHAKAVTKVLIGNVKFNNLQVEQAQCKLEVITTYSCTGCTTKPFAIIQAYDIKQEGILPITSNCSFDQNFISCNMDPYELTLADYQSNCHINVPALNISLHINFEFSFIGQLDPSKPIYAIESQMEVISGLVTSEGFVTGLLGVFSTVSLVGIGSNLILRIVKVWQYSSLMKRQANSLA